MICYNNDHFSAAYVTELPTQWFPKLSEVRPLPPPPYDSYI